MSLNDAGRLECLVRASSYSGLYISASVGLCFIRPEQLVPLLRRPINVLVRPSDLAY
jgi:hypothetical protein